MVQFSKLRLSGFKSFAENTELDILPGLTGIVGPNGCGKSNLTEALRWLMGETSPKSLRGGEMDDVIFAGTGKRSARNIAEVVLTLGNADRTAPEPYASLDALDVSRRIDRGMGSDYRINGKVVRATDVQLLFADSATGANSPSIVSQGRVAHLISAKPVERRRVLEDAAAISGLHNRRKEAETRLKAAAKNLERVADLLVQKTAQHEQLVRQAKQAERYRALSDALRRDEALAIALEWTQLAADNASAREAMGMANAAQNAVKQAMHDLGMQRDVLSRESEALEAQLQKHAQDMQARQRQQDRAEDALRRHDQARRDLDRQLQDLRQDEAHEGSMAAQATEKLAALTEEDGELQARLADLPMALAAGQAGRDAARDAHEVAQKRLNDALAEQSALAAQRQMLVQQQQRAQQERDQLTLESARLAQLLDKLDTDVAGLDTAQLVARAEQGERDLQSAQQMVASLEKSAEEAAQNARSATERLQNAQSGFNRIDIEVKTVMALVADRAKGSRFTPALQHVTVQPGYEQAVTTALGRDLHAGLNDDAPFYWQKAASAGFSWPAGIVTLAQMTSAPPELAAALAAVGVVADTAQGAAMSGALAPGQMLVSRDGHAWRWDGFRLTPRAQDAVQERETRQSLEQRNRLVILEQELTAAVDTLRAAQQAAQASQDLQDSVRRQLADARQAANQKQRDSSQLRSQAAREQQRQAELQAKRESARERQGDLADRLRRADAALAQLVEQTAGLPVHADGARLLAEQRNDAQRHDAAYRQAEQHLLQLQNQHSHGQSRARAIAGERREWQEREDNAIRRQKDLQARITEAETQAGALSPPEAMQEAIDAARDALATLARQDGALQAQRQELARRRQAADRAQQEQQDRMMAAREDFVRAETRFHGGQNQQAQLTERSLQALDCAPQDIAAQYGLSAADLALDPAGIRTRQEKARQERDRIGAVNLRAAEEADLIGGEIAALARDKDEIDAAIEKLRFGISTLNRDARRKMLAAFDNVNTRFRDVFTRLFNGGEAYLQLVDADDPLEAGLEIFASPPGKRLQSLTLLSGGEQSLTAIALVFAMFLTHPSPICILDEIDAALDDANVERICSLLHDFTKTHPTRFLVITHNPITMTYMDRLYGVTMVEKGISRLVSVDLAQHQPQIALAAE